VGSRSDLEALLMREVGFFSFPWGRQLDMSPEALEIAASRYDLFCSAFGGVKEPGKRARHIKRCGHSRSLWELELTLQGLLDFGGA
jgi:hypothetical protein